MKDRVGSEDISPDSIPEVRAIPVAFFCRKNICDPALVWSTGNNLSEARAKIPQDLIPKCIHGAMHSAASTML